MSCSGVDGAHFGLTEVFGRFPAIEDAGDQGDCQRPQLRRVLTAPNIDGIVIHPAMVYAADGGVFDRFARAARRGEAIVVVASAVVRGPLVHSDDLATLYVAALERAPPRSSYLGAAIAGFSVSRIARAFARHFGTPRQEPDLISADAIAAELGEWARGHARDQQLSGALARAELGWQPTHLGVQADIARWPRRRDVKE